MISNPRCSRNRVDTVLIGTVERYRGDCSCGWQGELVLTPPEAWAPLIAHLEQSASAARA